MEKPLTNCVLCGGQTEKVSEGRSYCPKCEYVDETIRSCPACGGPLHSLVKPQQMFNLSAYCHQCWVKAKQIKSRSVSTIPYALEASRRENHPHLQHLGEIPF